MASADIRILDSVHAPDAGVVINPVQVRRQLEVAVAQGIRFLLTENYHVEIPRTEVLLVDSADAVGPTRTKGIAESCVNPVAPALANAVYARFREPQS